MKQRSRYSKSSSKPGLIARWFGTRRRFGPTSEQLRNRRRLLYGVVTLVVLGGGTAGGAYVWRITRPTVDDIQAKADQAYADGEYELARDFYLELSGKNHSADVLHSLALCYEQLGDQEQLLARMTELAELGDSRGHLWLAKHLLAKEPLEPTDVSQAQQHLEAAVEKDPSSLFGRRQLVRLYLARRDTRKAIPLLYTLVADGHADKLDLALALFSVNRQEEAISTAREALFELSAKLEKNPDDLKLRLRAKEAAVMLGNFPIAEQLLLDGQKRIGEQPELTDSLSRLYGAWGVQQHRQSDDAAALDLLAKSAHITPVSPTTLAALREMCQHSKPQSAAARSQLQQALIRGDAPPALIHNLLADLAASQKDVLEAQRHWELAADDDPKSTTTINNLAVSLLQQVPANPQRALALIDRGIALAPNAPQLRATRGRILLHMGRWDEARDELNSVLRVLEKNTTVQLDMAEACLRSGFPDRARGNFDAALEQNPKAQLEVARIIARCGAAKQFGNYLEQAVNYYEEQTAQDPKQITLRLAWAESLLVAGKYPETEQVLIAGRQLSDDPSLASALASLYVSWSSRPGQEPAAAVDRLLQALEINPSHRGALLRLVELSETDNPAQDRAKAELDKLLAGEEPPAELLVVVGTHEWVAKHHTEARKYLERALQIKPEIPDLKNNLAWMLIYSDPVDAKRALELVNEALAVSPDHPNYRGTRAHVLATLGRWQDAKNDLEYTLRVDPKNTENRELFEKVTSHLER